MRRPYSFKKFKTASRNMRVTLSSWSGSPRNWITFAVEYFGCGLNVHRACVPISEQLALSGCDRGEFGVFPMSLKKSDDILELEL